MRPGSSLTTVGVVGVWAASCGLVVAGWLARQENAWMVTRFRPAYTARFWTRYLHLKGVSCRRTRRRSTWSTDVRLCVSVLAWQDSGQHRSDWETRIGTGSPRRARVGQPVTH